MTGEIPKNEVRTVAHTVSKLGLFSLFEKLHQDRNVVKIEHEPDGPERFKVTISYAIMDLPLQLAAVSTSIERAVGEANEIDHVRS